MLLRRILLVGAAAIFAVGGCMHALAFFSTARGIIEAAGVSAFFGAELKMLWLADSTTLLSLAVITSYIAIRPDRAPGTLVLLIGLISSATAALLYFYLGGFFAAHMLAVASILVLSAGLLALLPVHHSLAAPPVSATPVN